MAKVIRPKNRTMFHTVLQLWDDFALWPIEGYAIGRGLYAHRPFEPHLWDGATYKEKGWEISFYHGTRILTLKKAAQVERFAAVALAHLGKHGSFFHDVKLRDAFYLRDVYRYEGDRVRRLLDAWREHLEEG